MRTIQAGAVALLGWVAVSLAGAAPPVGWRGDGTGQFPGATPPAKWSGKTNVAWKVAMPGNSYGSPIVVGERLFVVSDPGELLCLDRKSGKVLWRKSTKDVKAPPVQRGFGFGGRGGFGRGGRGGFGGRGGPGGNQKQGAPKLAVGVDDRTNTLFIVSSDTLYKDVKKLFAYGFAARG